MRTTDTTALAERATFYERFADELDTERVVGDVASLPFDDARFDHVVCPEVIEHTMQPRRAVAQLVRVLASGGTLALIMPSRVWHPAIRLAAYGAFNALPFVHLVGRKAGAR